MFKQKPGRDAAPHDTIPADPLLRKKLAMVVLLLALAAAVYFGYLLAEIERVRSADTPDPTRLLKQLEWMSMGLVAVGSAFLIYLIQLGIRVFKCGQFPPPGARVVKDTPIRRGAPAKLLALFGVLLGLLVVAASLYAFRLIAAFLGTAPVI